MRHHPFKLALGLVISLGALALSLRGVTAGELWAQIAQVDYRYLVLYAVVLLLIQLVRTVRWGLLVAPVKRLPFGRLVSISAVGFMAILVLPLRLGEFARPYLVREPGRISGSAVLASVVVERLIDGLTVAAALAILLLGLPESVPHLAWARRGAFVMLFAFLGVLALLAAAHWRREQMSRLAGATLGTLSPQFAQAVTRRIDSFARGLASLPSTGATATALLLTAVFWGLNGLGTWLLALGFGLPLTLSQAFVCLGIRALGITLPAGPGMVGTFQAFTQFGLSMFLPGLPVARLAAYSNVLWLCQFVQITAVGLLFLGSRALTADRHAVTLGELSRADEALDDR